MKEVVGALEKFAPLPLQESYDNAGLQLGLTETEVSGALLCLDVTEKIVDEAIARDCNVIISHHPLIFHRLSHITGGNYVERAVAKAIKADIAIISMHTNLDNAQGGVSFMMAEKMGMTDVSFLCPPRSYSSGDDGPTVQYASGVIFCDATSAAWHCVAEPVRLPSTMPCARVPMPLSPAKCTITNTSDTTANCR